MSASFLHKKKWSSALYCQLLLNEISFHRCSKCAAFLAFDTSQKSNAHSGDSPPSLCIYRIFWIRSRSSPFLAFLPDLQITYSAGLRDGSIASGLLDSWWKMWGIRWGCEKNTRNINHRNIKECGRRHDFFFLFHIFFLLVHYWPLPSITKCSFPSPSPKEGSRESLFAVLFFF